MKILTILGARPQFIKAGSISREIAKHNDFVFRNIELDLYGEGKASKNIIRELRQ